MAGFLDVVILVLMSVTAFSILRSRNTVTCLSTRDTALPELWLI